MAAGAFSEAGKFETARDILGKTLFPG